MIASTASVGMMFLDALPSGVRDGGLVDRDLTWRWRRAVVRDVRPVAAVAQDRAQRDVHRVGADDALGRERHVDGDDDAWPGPASRRARRGSPTRPSKAATSSVPGSTQAVDVDVGRLGAVGDPLDELRRRRARTAPAGPRPRRDRRRAGGSRGSPSAIGPSCVDHHDEADTGVLRPARRPGRGSARCSSAGPGVLLAAHVDEPEVAGPEDVEGLLAGRVRSAERAEASPGVTASGWLRLALVHRP